MIYFIQNEVNRSIKIGYTSGEAMHRIRQLQTSSSERFVLLGVIPGTKDDEAFLHAQLDSYRLSGEWFRPHGDVLGWIKWLAEWSKRIATQKAPIEVTSNPFEPSPATLHAYRQPLEDCHLPPGFINDEPFALEDIVTHPMYGEGRVVSLQDGKIRIVFADGDTHTFIAAKSALRIIAS